MADTGDESGSCNSGEGSGGSVTPTVNTTATPTSPPPVNITHTLINGNLTGSATPSVTTTTTPTSPTPANITHTLINGNLTDTFGEITSPNYPSNYPDKVDAIHTILAEEGNIIRIRFDAMNIEYGGSSCNFDYVGIIDGNGSVLMNPTCGDIIPDVIHSFTNNVSVIFHSDQSVTKTGWKLTWSSEELLLQASTTVPLSTSTPVPVNINQTILYHNITDTNGEITSENYPSNYPNNVDTMHTILAGEGNTIWIRFEAMNIEDVSESARSEHEFEETLCPYDYIVIIEGNGSVLMDPTCGNNIPDVIHSFTNNVSVIFHSDQSGSKSGWKLTWSTHPSSGEVKSWNYPQEYSNNLNYTENIEVMSGEMIAITFVDLDIESSGSDMHCYFDYVMIMDDDGTELLPRTCGTITPPITVSRSNKVWVIFHSDNTVTKRGFHLTWSAVSP